MGAKFVWRSTAMLALIPAVMVVIPFPSVPPAARAAEATAAAGETQLISVSPAGEAADDSSTETSVSADGRFVAFTSLAQNLTDTPVPAATAQVYVRDVVTGKTVLVTVNAAGTAGADVSSWGPSISDDGRYVAFVSTARDLVTSVPLDGHSQIYLRDLQTGSTQLVSREASGKAAGIYNSFDPALSGDGSRLAFATVATNLSPGASPGASQILEADNSGGAMVIARMISVSDSSSSSPGAVGNANSRAPSLSRDGTVVSFESVATNLSSNPVSGAVSQVFLHAIDSGSTGLVSVAMDNLSGGNGDSTDADVSADGRRVAYVSKAGNLSTRVLGTKDPEIYLRDTAAIASQLVSVDHDGIWAANGRSISPMLSDDGERVAFVSNATDLVRADTRGAPQVYSRDLRLGVTSLVSASGADPLRGAGGSGAGYATVSGNGKVVAFSAPRGLPAGTAAGPAQIYLRGLEEPMVARVGGEDRYTVSARLSASTFPTGVPVAYIASGAVFSDALSGSSAAGTQGGPVLLVTKDSIPGAIADELARLRPDEIIVLGGLNTIGAGVETALKKFGAPVSRISGSDRYAVSAATSKASSATPVDTVFVASGAVFPDALSGSAAAGLLGGPVLLTEKDAVPASIVSELKRLHPRTIVVLGGVNTISDATLTALKPLAVNVRRIAGADRYEISANVAAEFFPTTHVVYVASGAVFPDALSGSAAAIADHAPVLLVTKDSLPTSVAAQLGRLTPDRIVVLGGPNTISDALTADLTDYLHK